MKACWFEGDWEGQEFVRVDGQEARHLLKSFRIQIGEQVLLLNGQGLKAQGRVIEKNRREVSIEIEDCQQAPPVQGPDLFVAQVKREAMEEVVRMAAAFAARRLFIGRSEYSQATSLKGERLERLIRSSCKQSNNPWRPEIFQDRDLASLAGPLLVFHPGQASPPCPSSPPSRPTLAFGPEGGFSLADQEVLAAHGAQWVSFPTPLLTTPQAVAAGLGWWTLSTASSPFLGDVQK